MKKLLMGNLLLLMHGEIVVEVSDREVLEKVQIKAVNLITGLKGKTYLEKLNELGLLTMDQRRKRFDLIQTFKLIRGNDKVNAKSGWFRSCKTYQNESV